MLKWWHIRNNKNIHNIYSNDKAALAIHFSVLHSCEQRGYAQATLYSQKLYAQISWQIEYPHCIIILS